MNHAEQREYRDSPAKVSDYVRIGYRIMTNDIEGMLQQLRR